VTRERVAIAPTSQDPERVSAVVERARRRGFHRFVLDASTRFAPNPGEEVVRRRGDELLPEGRPPVPVVTVSEERELERAVSQVPEGGAVAIEWAGDRMIPLENVVAARGRKFEVWSYARTPSEVPGALGALEHGADHVIVAVSGPSDIDALESVVEGPLPAGLDWVLRPVISVKPAGVGDRVIVDTTSLLRPAEGLLVGSAAAFLFHIASEAVGSRFSRPRPFRVNAGAAHLYVLMSDGTTRYLAELSPGDSVLAVEPNGSSRSVRVGRVKVERRPLVAVTADDDGVPRTVFLQEAETVRVSAGPSRVATTELQVGTSVFGVRLPAARHLGTAVQETIEER
jgi:3-dehydroquinate synthase II